MQLHGQLRSHNEIYHERIWFTCDMCDYQAEQKLSLLLPVQLKDWILMPIKKLQWNISWKNMVLCDYQAQQKRSLEGHIH